MLYTKYVYYFQGAGLILLVAMIGAIVLTLRHKEGVKRQSIAAQVARGPKTAMEVVKVASGERDHPGGPVAGRDAHDASGSATISPLPRSCSRSASSASSSTARTSSSS